MRGVVGLPIRLSVHLSFRPTIYSNILPSVLPSLCPSRELSSGEQGPPPLLKLSEPPQGILLAHRWAPDRLLLSIVVLLVPKRVYSVHVHSLVGLFISVYLLIHLFCLMAVHPSICLFVCPSGFPSVRPFDRLSKKVLTRLKKRHSPSRGGINWYENSASPIFMSSCWPICL